MEKIKKMKKITNNERDKKNEEDGKGGGNETLKQIRER